jgi:hypothetical protein
MGYKGKEGLKKLHLRVRTGQKDCIKERKDGLKDGAL